jgi:hypothetical protein
MDVVGAISSTQGSRKFGKTMIREPPGQTAQPPHYSPQASVLVKLFSVRHVVWYGRVGSAADDILEVFSVLYFS